MTDYYLKYLKYKSKYIELKTAGGIQDKIADGIVSALKSQASNLKSQVRNMKPEDVIKTITMIEKTLEKVPERLRQPIIDILNEIKKMDFNKINAAKTDLSKMLATIPDPSITHPAVL